MKGYECKTVHSIYERIKHHKIDGNIAHKTATERNLMSGFHRYSRGLVCLVMSMDKNVSSTHCDPTENNLVVLNRCVL